VSRLLNGFPAGVKITIGDIVRHRIREHKDILLDQTDLLAQILLPVVPHIHAVHLDGALLHIVKPEQDIGNGRLARAGLSYKGHRLTPGHLQVKIFEHRPVRQIAKPHMGKLNLTLHLPVSRRRRLIRQLRRLRH
jgi:hypothetical protein